MKGLNTEKLRYNIDKRITADVKSGRVGGCSVRVMQCGSVVYENCFSSEKFPVHKDTIFRLASMTKPITALAVFICIDRGLLQLDDPVSKYLPKFAHMQIGELRNGKPVAVADAQKEITISNLLTHTSGLGSGPVGDSFRAKMTGSEHQKTLSAAVAHYANCLLDFEPNTQQFYSGIFAFDVLARIVEIVTGVSFDTFVDQEICKKLDMKDTTFVPTKQQRQRLIPMHNYSLETGVSAEPPTDGGMFENFPITYTAGGAGLASTVEDYSHFAQMLLMKGSYNGKQIVSPERIEEMAAAVIPYELMPSNERWGLSVRVIMDESYGHLPVGAFGWSGAYGTHFWVDPVNQVTAIYMKNSRYDGGSCALTAANFEVDVTASFDD